MTVRDRLRDDPPGRCQSGYSAGALENPDVEPRLGNGELGRLDSLNSGRPPGLAGLSVR